MLVYYSTLVKKKNSLLKGCEALEQAQKVIDSLSPEVIIKHVDVTVGAMVL